MYHYSLINVWNNKSPELTQEIIDFWLSEKVISEPDARQRVNQVFIIARDQEGEIIGVNTIYKQYNTQLDNLLFYYRTYISPRARGSQIALEMMLATRDYLEARYDDTREADAIGILLEVENKKLQKRLNQAIWPGSNFVYIGKNKRGYHMRVYYFKNALIS